MIKTWNTLIWCQNIDKKVMKEINHFMNHFKLKKDFFRLLRNFKKFLPVKKLSNFKVFHFQDLYSHSKKFREDKLFILTVEFYKFLS